MDDFIFTVDPQSPETCIPLTFLGQTWLQRLQMRVSEAESLRPSAVLYSKNRALLHAENHVIIAFGRKMMEDSLGEVRSALETLGQSTKDAQAMVDAWAAARMKIAEVHRTRPASSMLNNH